MCIRDSYSPIAMAKNAIGMAIACEEYGAKLDVYKRQELDEKYASVILRRAVENGIPPEDIFVERNGEKMMYSDLVKEVEVPDE